MWTKETALPVIQRAYKDKKLSAQNGALACLYTSDCGPCVIGLLLSPEDALRFDNYNDERSAPFYTLAADNQLNALFDPLDHQWFDQLQQLYDQWLTRFYRNDNSYEAAFKKYIGL